MIYFFRISIDFWRATVTCEGESGYRLKGSIKFGDM